MHPGGFFTPTCVLLLVMLQWHLEMMVHFCGAEMVHNRAFATKDVFQTKQKMNKGRTAVREGWPGDVAP